MKLALANIFTLHIHLSPAMPHGHPSMVSMPAPLILITIVMQYSGTSQTPMGCALFYIIWKRPLLRECFCTLLHTHAGYADEKGLLCKKTHFIISNALLSNSKSSVTCSHIQDKFTELISEGTVLQMLPKFRFRRRNQTTPNTSLQLLWDPVKPGITTTE